MMKLLLKLFLYLAVFFIAILVFLPKEKLYNLAEEKLALQNIIISNEQRIKKAFSLDLKNMEVYYDGIDAALVNNLNITSYLCLSKIKIKDIRISNSFKNIFPNKIENLELKHSVLDFNKVNIFSKGDYGEIEGKFLIFENKIIAELKPSNIMKSKYRNILKQFKLKEGRYYYEYKF